METLTIEIILKSSCKEPKSIITDLCEKFLKSVEVYPGAIFNNFDETLEEYVKSIIIDDLDLDKAIVLSDVEINWVLYKLHKSCPFVDTIQLDGCQEVNTLSTSWMVPSTEFHKLWENLIYDSTIKQNLLRYVKTTMLFADKGVNPNIVCSNKVVLLHGPPGTGKTSLCKALAHKLAARMNYRYKRGQLVEINSHSLFSKWFSESGKLVSAMFQKIREIIDEPDTLVCVLIDEVESLAHARNKCNSGTEPSDSIRVVNAVLTEIDQIKRYPNVLILTTSNMTGAIDLAFVDRADIKQYIGVPSSQAIYQIYFTCLEEMMKSGIVVPQKLLPVNSPALSRSRGYDDTEFKTSLVLKELSELSVGLSGRTLRKIPFLAHALFLKSAIVGLNDFLDAMKSSIDYKKKEERETF